MLREHIQELPHDWETFLRGTSIPAYCDDCDSKVATDDVEDFSDEHGHHLQLCLGCVDNRGSDPLDNRE